MYQKKYVRFNLVADMGQVNEDFENYMEAYRNYCRQARFKHPATLYGISEDSEISVIKSRS